MSAEKQIVDYWLNKRGFFTVGNIKSANKDVGLLALKLEKSVVRELFHAQVNCSITGSISEKANLSEVISLIAKNNFEDASIKKVINNFLKQFPGEKDNIKNLLVLGALPRSRRQEIINSFKERNIEVYEFEKILLAVMQGLDRQYYRHDVLRSLQLMKYLLLSNPALLSELLGNEGDILNVHTRKEFLASLLKQEVVKKHFKGADIEQLMEILSYSKLRSPDQLASLVEDKILTRKTRKPFLKALLEKEKMRQAYKEETEEPKRDKPLKEFF